MLWKVEGEILGKFLEKFWVGVETLVWYSILMSWLEVIGMSFRGHLKWNNRIYEYVIMKLVIFMNFLFVFMMFYDTKRYLGHHQKYHSFE